MKHALTMLLIVLFPLVKSTSTMASEPVQRLQRATGLWKVTPATSPFSWEICVDETKDRLIDDDLWRDFENKCSVESQSRDGDQYKFRSTCEDVTLIGTFKGDLSQAYIWTTETSFDLRGKTEVQHLLLTATYEGVCPPDLAPGAKKMRGGLIIKSPYESR